MSLFAILLGGDAVVTARLKTQIARARVIAADRGMIHAAALNVTPELWVGDFDSAGSELVVQYKSVPRLTFPADKAATDGALAVQEAIARGATRLILVGGMGGQADHVLGHFTMLLRLALDGLGVTLTSGNEEAHALLPGTTEFDLKPGVRLSIIPFSDLKGLSLTGVKWPLEKRDVELGDTLTLSNVAFGNVTATLAQGSAVAIATFGRHHD